MPEPLLITNSKFNIALMPGLANRHGLITGVTMRLIATFMLCSIIIGCASIDSGKGKRSKPSDPLPPSTRPTYNLAGYPPAFKDGYIDGCETAKKTSYGYKDESRFSKDSQYRNGWKDGFNICLNKK